MSATKRFFVYCKSAFGIKRKTSTFKMSHFLTEFEKREDEFQKQFDDIKMPPMSPRIVISVELLGFRKMTTQWSTGLFDTPDPQFIVSCPKIKRPHLRTFKTAVHPNATSGFVGESFKFVVPKNHDLEKEFLIEIGLYDNDIGFDDFIGKPSIDVSKLPGDVYQTTLDFGENQGQLDIRISRTSQTSPDFRYSVGLPPEEKAFRKKRIPFVCKAMKTILGKEGPKTPQDTPVVSLVGSGGGYRAVVGMCGAMEALRDAGLLDVITYNCGLSGSSWYFTSAYTLRGVKAKQQPDFHSTIRERLGNCLLLDAVKPSTIKDYQRYLTEHRQNDTQPHTIVDYFPGFLVGRQLLQNKMEVPLRDSVSYVYDGEVPYPILVALNVKNSMKASAYHAYVERTPFEISLPSYGINIAPSCEGAAWDSGVIVRKFPEFPIHFTMGMTGCAFSIHLDSFFTDGHEFRDETGGKAENEKIPSESLFKNEKTEEVSNKLHHQIVDRIKKSTLFSTRNGLIGRTALLLNFTLGLEKVERFLLNPFGGRDESNSEDSKRSRFGIEDVKEHISTEKNILAFADAGILNNVSTSVVLRPQRTTDIVIVMDFTGYESDNNFSYQPLTDAAKHAWQSGLEFPDIDLNEISNSPPRDFFLFPSHGPNCPSVLWFTLCNTNFKQAKNYKPRSTAELPDGEKRKFNDFTVYGEDSPYSTFTFKYDNYHFDQLRELMYYNVTSHVEEIKKTLANTVQSKQQRLHCLSTSKL